MLIAFSPLTDLALRVAELLAWVDVRASGHLFSHLPLIPSCLYPGWLDLEGNP